MYLMSADFPNSPSANTSAGLPITFGSLMEFPEDPIACMRRLHAAHGELAVLQQDEQRLVFVFGQKWNQRVLSDAKTFHSRFFAIRGPRHSSQRRVTSGLLSMNGDQHKQHRRMVMAPFQKLAIAHYHEPICDLTNQMLATWKTGQVRDIHEEMTQHMLRVTSAILFGVDVPEMAYRLGEMIDRWVHMNHETGMGAFVSDTRLTDNYERLLGLAEKLEEDVKQLIEMRRSGERLGNDVLSLMIRANEQDGFINDDQLTGHIALMFGAAHLTTAHTLTWTLFLLAQHPSVMRTVFEELNSSRSSATPTADEVAEMPITERVIKESMRVLPASSYSQRIAAEPAELGPLKLSPGTPVVFSQFITHHLPELFPNPDRFEPDRWRTIAPSPYAYLPFGAGPRMCIGAPMAMMILKTALPMILKRFRLSVVPGAEISSKVISTMLGPTTSVPMQVSPADGQFQSSPVTGNIRTLVELPEVTESIRSAA